MTLTVRVISPDRVIVQQEAEEIILPSTTGQLGVLTDHVPLMTAIDIGVLRYRTKNNWEAIAVLGGFAEIENNEVTVLVNEAELGASINPEQAKAEFTTAQARLNQVTEGNKLEKIQAERGFQRARARLQATTNL